MLSFVAPALVFFVADFARRRVAERTARCAVAATSDAAMATVLVPMPGFSNAQLTGGVVRLRHRDVSWMWHPFTIAGAADGAAIVHVFDAGGWTRAFCGLAARQPVVELEVRPYFSTDLSRFVVDAGLAQLINAKPHVLKTSCGLW